MVHLYLVDDEAATTAWIQAKNGLELYSYNLHNLITNEKLADKFEAGDKVKLGCHQQDYPITQQLAWGIKRKV